MNMLNNKWKDDFSPLDEEGSSYVDTAYSKAYVRHLFKAGELLGGMIASMHNLAFYMWLVDEARKHILAGTFSSWKDTMVRKISTRL
ncbi:MAG: tRNA-guanine transglycosylase, partial [Desulfomonilia bacterium]|nr:tRNA-guanine transglycosylase [Desulfomonilia bacterium]